jgi:nitrate reductase cytochrome c-type subunit
VLGHQAIGDLVVLPVVTQLRRRRHRAEGKDERYSDCECAEEENEQPVSAAEGENARSERSFPRRTGPWIPHSIGHTFNSQNWQRTSGVPQCQHNTVGQPHPVSLAFGETILAQWEWQVK